ncbi:MAG: glucosamine-6-phosphate deaminase [Roseburia sp.]|nr:glucosamine-6-phosphate deaminase [Roseburia sp.]
MKVIIVEDYEKMVKKAFRIIKNIVKTNPYAVLGLVSGSTTIGLYKLMAEDCKENKTSYEHIRTVNLDEYKGLAATNEQSYAYFMRKHLFDELDVNEDNINIEYGLAEDDEKECKRYDELLESLPRDIQILGLGSNGHIAFNEPDTRFGSETHVANLTESTINDNSRLFKDKSDVPKQAYTVGLKSIMQAKRILLLASGASKAEAVYKLVKGEITEEIPASVLQLHPNCTVIVDKDAAKLL